MSAELYNSRIIETYIRLIKARYSYIDINSLLKSADMKAYEVADQGHWFTQEQVDSFYEKIVQLTGNVHIAREAGNYAASPDTLGVMRQYILGFINPTDAFKLINKATLNFTRSATYESRKISSNSVEIIVTPREGVSEKPFQCENRIGFFEAVIVLYGLKPPRIDHTECIFHGAANCSYTITWQSSLSMTVKKISIITALLFVLTALMMSGFGLFAYLDKLMYLFVVVALLFTAVIATLEKKELKASLDHTNDSTDKLIELIDTNYNNTLMTNEIGKILSTCTNSEDILELLIKIMKKRLDYDRGLIFLTNQEKNKLILQAGFGYSSEQRELLESISFHLDRPESKGVFVVSFREQRPFLINDLNEIEENLSPQSLQFVKKMGSRSFICCPIISEDKSIGILAVDNVKTKRTLVESDITRLMGIASVIGISLRNAELIEAKVRQFNSVLQVLAASIDARDSLTAGHSEKVTEYTVGICNQLGLPRDELEVIRVAALLHDYGKIGVPDSILKKEGTLSPDEYAVVITHAEKTKEILSRVNFEGIYCKIPEIAGAHHEKIDGSGYPMGLKGAEIPLGSKIIAVADYFEAITSKRHYRDPMPIEEALLLLRNNCGTLFDKQIVDAFFHYYFTKTSTDPMYFDDGTYPLGIRRKPRIPNHSEVSFSVAGKTDFAFSEDISMHGVYVVTDKEDVPEGAPVELSIRLQDNVPTIEAIGRVAWVNSRASLKKPAFPLGFGVELIEFKGMTEKLLESFLNNFTQYNCLQGN